MLEVAETEEGIGAKESARSCATCDEVCKREERVRWLWNDTWENVMYRCYMEG